MRARSRQAHQEDADSLKCSAAICFFRCRGVRCRGGDGQRSRIYEDGCYGLGGGESGTEDKEDQKLDGVEARESTHVGLGHRCDLEEHYIILWFVFELYANLFGVFRDGMETLKLATKYKLATLMFQSGSGFQWTHPVIFHQISQRMFHHHVAAFLLALFASI